MLSKSKLAEAQTAEARERLFRWSCVTPPSVEECIFIINNAHHITLSTLIRNVNKVDLMELIKGLGYTSLEHIKKDYAVNYLKSKTTEGKLVYILEWSRIEHMFF